MTDAGADEALTVRAIGEFGLIDRLARILNGAHVDPLRPETAGTIGIGDDAALWQPTPGMREVLTTDALVEDAHFRHGTTSWHDLGWKALAQNVSDIAAMGAVPTRAFITLGLRPDARVADLDALYEGMASLQQAMSELDCGFVFAGGDTVSSPVTILSVTVVGELAGDGLRRAAGRPGDLLAVTGSLGGSAGGLAILESGDVPSGNLDVAALVGAHRRPRPRVVEGLTVAGAGVRCGMDLSDGLLGDSGKLAYASGLRAVLDLPTLPIPRALSRRLGEDPARMLALAGGEDFELLIAAPPDVMRRAEIALAEKDSDHQFSGQIAPLTVVGRLEAGTPGQVTVLDQHGQPIQPPRSSWDHFRQADRPSETRP
jgi:thiamine-monophosphate kinase